MTRSLAVSGFITMALALAAGAVASPSSPAAPPATLIVFDASGSMRERIKGETKMDIAKQAVRDLVAGLPDGAEIGLVVYSHRKPRDCSDIELLIPPAKLDRAAFLAAVEAIKPNGLTPLSAALEFAATTLDFAKKPARVILLSDGAETCGGDPCATAARLKKEGNDIVVHAVAFDMSARDARSIACIANVTGGRFLQAKDAASLRDALAVAVAETIAPPPPPPPPPAPVEEAAPPPPPPPPPPEVTLQVPPSALAGSEFAVQWTGPNAPGDFLTIVVEGTPDDDDGNLAYTRQGSPLALTAPIEPGAAEVRYVDGQSRRVLGRATLKISGVEVTLAAPDEATAGAPVSIDWTGPNNEGDYLTIVPKATPDRAYLRYAATRQGSPVVLPAPMDLGSAEVRYVSGQHGRVLARRPIAIVAAEVTLEAPAEIVAEAPVEIAWTGPNNEGDYLTIVAKSEPDGKYAKYARTTRGSPLTVEAPAEPGDAEVRYMSGEGGRVLARRTIKIVAAEATLAAPEEVVAEAAVEIAWTGPNNTGDYITIVAKSASEGSYGKYTRTSQGTPLSVFAPAEPGEAEIRYMTGGRKLLARRPIKVVAAEVTLTAPDETVAESPVEISWTGPNNKGDYVTIVMKSARDGDYAKYTYTRQGTPLSVVAPSQPGEAEIRYMSGERKVLARRPIKVVGADVTLEAPAQAVAGSTVPIAWTGPNNQGDYITVVRKTARDGEYGKYAYTNRGSPVSVPAPIDAGDAEVRYVSGQGKVLARRPITIAAAEITLMVPARAPLGAPVSVEWTGPNNPGDYLTIVAAAARDNEHGAYAYSKGGSPARIDPPKKAGPCEVRYISGQGGRVLARTPIEIVEAAKP